MYVKIQAALDGQAGRVASDPADWRCKSCFKRKAVGAKRLTLNLPVTFVSTRSQIKMEVGRVSLPIGKPYTHVIIINN